MPIMRLCVWHVEFRNEPSRPVAANPRLTFLLLLPPPPQRITKRENEATALRAQLGPVVLPPPSSMADTAPAAVPVGVAASMTDMQRQVIFAEADVVACDVEIAAAIRELAVLRAKRRQLDVDKDKLRSGMFDLALTAIESMAAAAVPTNNFNAAAAAPLTAAMPAPLRSDSALATKLRVNRQWKLHRIELHLAAQRQRLMKMPPSTDESLKLPDEVMMLVLGLLLVPELAVAATACRRWYRLARTDPLRQLWDEHRVFAKYRRSIKHHPRRLLMDARNAEESRWGSHTGARPHGYATSPVLIVDSNSGAVATIKGDRSSFDDHGEQTIVTTSVYVWGSEEDWASGRAPEVLGAPWRTNFNVTAMAFGHCTDGIHCLCGRGRSLMTVGFMSPDEGPPWMRLVRKWVNQSEDKRDGMIDADEPDWILAERYIIGADFRDGAIVALGTSNGIVVAASRHGEMTMWTDADQLPYLHRKFVARHHQAPGVHPPFERKHLALSSGGTLATIAGGAVIFWVAPASLEPGADRVMTEPQGQSHRGPADEDIVTIQWSECGTPDATWYSEGTVGSMLYGGSASGSVVEWSSAGKALRVFACDFPASMQHGDLGLLDRKHADAVSKSFYDGMCETIRESLDSLGLDWTPGDLPLPGGHWGPGVPSQEQVRRGEQHGQREWELGWERALAACCEGRALQNFPGMLQLLKERYGDMPAYEVLDRERKDEMIGIQRQSVIFQSSEFKASGLHVEICELAVGKEAIYAGCSAGYVFKIPLFGGSAQPFVPNEALTVPFTLAITSIQSVCKGTRSWKDALLSSTDSDRQSISIWGPTNMRANCKRCSELSGDDDHETVLVESLCDDWDEAAFQRALKREGRDMFCDGCKEDTCVSCSSEMEACPCAMCTSYFQFCADCGQSGHCTGCQKQFCGGCLAVPGETAAKISDVLADFANDLYDASEPYCRECITTRFKIMEDPEECPLCGSIQDVTDMAGCGECNALCCKLCVNKSANTKPGMVRDHDSPLRLSEVTHHWMVWVSEAGNIRARHSLPSCSACGREDAEE